MKTFTHAVFNGERVFTTKCRVKHYKPDYLTKDMSDLYKTIFELMLIGVEFAVTPQVSHFSSHEGDYIGEVPRKFVDDVVHFMRRRYYINPNTLDPYKTDSCNQRPRTYGHGKIELPDNWRDRCDHYWKKPFILKL